MDKLKNLSIRKTIFLYMAICLLCSFFLSAAIGETASRIQQRVWFKYVDLEKYQKAINNEQPFTIERPANFDMSSLDKIVSEMCDFLETFNSVIVSVMGSGIAVFLFYRNKLKAPLDELNKASKRIAENDLDFAISYHNQDEMGELCFEFERMRNQLMQNNQVLWRKLEEEKILRAAIAHDIRSPLTVLKGYQEMLLTYMPEGTITTEKTVEMLSEGMKQIVRMDLFIETMRKMNSLEARELQHAEISRETLKEDIQAEINILAGKTDKNAVLSIDETDKKFIGDKEIIMEVIENLISNALRYASEQIKIEVQWNNQRLSVCVVDDGNGFTEDEKIVTKAFYQKNVKDSLEHAGLGMYISRMYCEKHGGNLMLENSEYGGARVTATFGRIV